MSEWPRMASPVWRIEVTLGSATGAFDQWMEFLALSCGRHTVRADDHRSFSGWVGTTDICGIAAVDIGCNVQVVERTPGDVRHEGLEHFCVGLQVRGSAHI